MSVKPFKYFVSYERTDSAFALKLAKDLRAAGVRLWLDQLDIVGGQRWDRAIEGALADSEGLIVVLTPESVASDNVMDEVSYALEKGKLVVPVLRRECDVPFRLRRVQYIDFQEYEDGIADLTRALGVERTQHSKSRAGLRKTPDIQLESKTLTESVTARPASELMRSGNVANRSPSPNQSGSPPTEKNLVRLTKQTAHAKTVATRDRFLGAAILATFSLTVATLPVAPGYTFNWPLYATLLVVVGLIAGSVCGTRRIAIATSMAGALAGIALNYIIKATLGEGDIYFFSLGSAPAIGELLGAFVGVGLAWWRSNSRS